MFLFLFFSTLLLCSFFRLQDIFHVKNGSTTLLLFSPENAKNLGRSDNVKRRKKTEMALVQKRQRILYEVYCQIYFNTII